MNKLLSLVAIGVAAVAMVGCGGSTSGLSGGKPRIRVVNADQSVGSIDAKIDNTAYATNLAYMSFGDYERYDNGNLQIDLTKSSDQTVLYSDNANLFEINKFYSVIALPGAGANTVDPLVIEDSRSVPNSGRTLLRFVHGASTFNTDVNVFVTAPGDPLPVNPDATISYRGQSLDYFDEPEGSREVRITRASDGAILYDETLSLTSGTTRTALIVDGASSSVVDVVILPDKN